MKKHCHSLMISLIIMTILSLSVMASDDTVNMAGQLKDYSPLLNTIKNVPEDEDSPFLPQANKQKTNLQKSDVLKKNSDQLSSDITIMGAPIPDPPPSKTKIETKENHKVSKLPKEAVIPSQYDLETKRPPFQEAKNEETLAQIMSLRTYGMGIRLYNDSFTYDSRKDQKGASLFQKIFRESKMATPHVMLMLSGQRYHRNALGLSGYGVNVGTGFNSGNAYFVNGTFNPDILVILWSFPLDFYLLHEIELGSWGHFGGKIGPSLMSLWQIRTDLAWGHPRKSRFQWSVGYFFEAYVGINMGRFAPEMLLNEYHSDGMTNFFLDLFVRSHQFGQFKNKDVKISGLSFGIGITFDLL